MPHAALDRPSAWVERFLGLVPAEGRVLDVAAGGGRHTLLAELGRGGQGCVFLANQISLGDRPVVLKLTPCDGQEHLSLARHLAP